MAIKRSSNVANNITFSHVHQDKQLMVFGYDSITVSYAWEFISVSMCYSQGDEFNTSLSTLCTVPTSPCLPVLLAPTCFGVRSGILCIVLGVVIFRGTVICYPERR